ncbi:hypothetical protein L198_01544 [Cryptococcus wingfieldii CBS 7118]|uniref:Uncharacterized protein n=1 Tax=Cryptococcus wingfieldii CBS 7118 TaxID=1295528 RepID=A0A1E3K280_9TREE|nr:hypothetical protein L198_01544 [Cryptococcus wingfieldii CBS 7118]ODO06312.1 hypothetical protein L198_01544 [Cryptococcus wingfieldii CBS 7118]
MLTAVNTRALIRPSLSAYLSTSASSSSAAAPPTRPRRRSERSEGSSVGVNLVAPPDPVSNIRPIIYASKPATRPSANSPYSASEFPAGNYGDARLDNMELEWRLRRERVDLANHRFWASTNQSFTSQQEHRLSLLPPASDPPSAEDIRLREDCLTQFYADWQIANQDRQIRWVKEWWREIWEGLKIQAKLYVMKGVKRG